MKKSSVIDPESTPAEFDAPIPLQYQPVDRSSDIDFTGEVSLTKQSEAQACDVNYIMGQFEKTGLIPHVSQYQGQYGFLPDSVSYHESLNAVIEAQAAFESLPAKIRSRFGNDPAAFLDFVQDPDNRSEMASMGLLSLPADVGPQPPHSDGTTSAEPPTAASTPSPKGGK